MSVEQAAKPKRRLLSPEKNHRTQSAVVLGYQLPAHLREKYLSLPVFAPG